MKILQLPLMIYILGLVKCSDDRPNIVFIVADDLGWADVSWNNPSIVSPNLQWLHKRSVILKNYYVQPVCTPSRAAFLTGYYPVHLGLQGGALNPVTPGFIPVQIPTIAEKLKHIGYTTHAIGKWHVGYCRKEVLPTRRGFDTFYGMWGGEANYTDHSVRALSKDHKKVYDFRDGEKQVEDQEGVYSAHSFSHRAANIIRNHKDDNASPFFIYLAYQNVHLPLQKPDSKYMNMNNHLDGDRRIKAAMVTAMDAGVETVIDALKKTGKFDNTIIVFTTDNGGSVTAASLNFPYRGSKGTLYEGGTKAVGFIHSSELEHGAYHGLLHAVDWMPTLLRAAGADPHNDNFDGVDQWNHLKNNQGTARDEILYNIDEVKRNAAIRVGKWKLILGRQSLTKSGFPTLTDAHMLFNLENDPYEYKDLSYDKEDVVKMLYERLRRYKKTMVKSVQADECPEPSDFLRYGALTYGWCTDQAKCK